MLNFPYLDSVKSSTLKGKELNQLEEGHTASDIDLENQVGIIIIYTTIILFKTCNYNETVAHIYKLIVEPSNHWLSTYYIKL